MKSPQRGEKWRCRECGKTFVSEHWIDAHLSRAHVIATESDAVCLADYCAMLGCPSAATAAAAAARDAPTPASIDSCIAVLSLCFPHNLSSPFFNDARSKYCESTLASKAARISRPMWRAAKNALLALGAIGVFLVGLRKAYLMDLANPISKEGVAAARVVLEARRAAKKQAEMEAAASVAAAKSAAKK
jgi:hypothetical protein